MKKLTAMLLALAMVFALCACGGPTEEEARAISRGRSKGLLS